MQRRDAIKSMAWSSGTMLSIPALTALLEGCQVESGPDWAPSFFSAEQIDLISHVADVIIPKTDSPGALDAQVPRYIDLMANDILPEKMTTAFIAELEAFQAACKSATGKNFQALNEEEKIAELSKAEEEAMKASSKEPKFFSMMKQASMAGFFTSEVGATQALNYVKIPGVYEPCIPLEEGQKAWAI